MQSNVFTSYDHRHQRNSIVIRDRTDISSSKIENIKKKKKKQSDIGFVYFRYFNCLFHSVAFVNLLGDHYENISIPPVVGKGKSHISYFGVFKIGELLSLTYIIKTTLLL